MLLGLERSKLPSTWEAAKPYAWLQRTSTYPTPPRAVFPERKCTRSRGPAIALMFFVGSFQYARTSFSAPLASVALHGSAGDAPQRRMYEKVRRTLTSRS